jgi:hypothetical protein
MQASSQRSESCLDLYTALKQAEHALQAKTRFTSVDNRVNIAGPVTTLIKVDFKATQSLRTKRYQYLTQCDLYKACFTAFTAEADGRCARSAKPATNSNHQLSDSQHRRWQWLYSVAVD